jgi:hypothetical protein
MASFVFNLEVFVLRTASEHKTTSTYPTALHLVNKFTLRIDEGFHKVSALLVILSQMNTVHPSI